MALLKLKPNTPGQRGAVRVVNKDLHKGQSFSALTVPKKAINGRNNSGQITVRHRGGGHKKNYRIIDFKRIKDGVAAKVERLEYDPNRSANIALLLYADGERRYIIAPRNIAVGDVVRSGIDAGIRPGNALPLKNIPIGSVIHCVELKPGKGCADGAFGRCGCTIYRARR